MAVEERAAWTAEGWTEPDDPENLCRAFAGCGRRGGRLLTGFDRTFLWGLFGHPPLPAGRAGGVALLGDACPPMLPFLAQGAGMALEDRLGAATTLDAAQDLDPGLAA